MITIHKSNQQHMEGYMGSKNAYVYGPKRKSTFRFILIYISIYRGLYFHTKIIFKRKNSSI